MKKFLVTLAFLLGLASASQAQHIRFLPGETENDGELQISVTEFTASDAFGGGHKVTLYGVVHMADQEYYAAVQADLDRFDAVLYEGIKNGAIVNPETRILNAIQKGMGKMLGLIFQKDGIDYTRPNLVHADISSDELQEAMGEERLTPFGNLPAETQQGIAPLLEMAGSLVDQLLSQNTALQAQLKSQFGRQIAETDMKTAMPEQLYQSIVVQRNQIVMDILSAQRTNHPEKKNIAIFYGAGHMDDFVERLTALDYTQTSQRWMTAWKIGNGAKPEAQPEAQPEAPAPPEIPAPENR